MTPLEAVKRLLEANESGLLPSDADGNCWYCFWHLLHDGSGHDPDCPWPSLPQIVAVLEAAERITALRYEGTPEESESRLPSLLRELTGMMRGEEIKA